MSVLLLVALQLWSPQNEAAINWNAESVVVSWYNQGKKTASGERFDPKEFTAAHRDWDFGTELLLVNPENHSRVIVRVNDRGPFIKGRDLDISEGAAKKLGFRKKGVGKMFVFILPPGLRPFD